jgi:glycosyltransferase involved in cell wall biosynthesis
MSRKPFFSVVLPTYNRAQFLPLAIKSVLQQTFEDFELVISNGGSTDNTKEVVAGFDDPRINYIESCKQLSMSDNYTSAINHTNGEYIIFFSDDDAFIPTMLERIEQVIKDTKTKMIVFPFAHYYHEPSNENGLKIQKNSLYLPRYSGKLCKLKSIDGIKRFCNVAGLINEAIDWNQIYPLIGNIVCHHSLINELKMKEVDFFATIPVDIYFMTLILEITEDYIVFDQPLLVWSKWSKNSSSENFKDITSLRNHYEKLLNGRKLEFVPLKFPLPLNCYANAVLQAQNQINSNKAKINVNWEWYFINMYQYLLSYKKRGINVDNEIEEYKLVYSEQSLSFKVKFLYENIWFKTKETFKNKLPQISNLIKSVIGGKFLTAKPIIIVGNENKFNDFLSAAVFLDENIEEFNLSNGANKYL